MRERKIKQAVILAGGLGTRLRPFTESRPKCMYPFEGEPFLGYLLRQVKAFGIEEVLLLLGYLPDQIKAYVGDGSRFGLRAVYDITPVEYDTGFRLRSAAEKLQPYFLLLYCDNYCPLDFHKAVETYFLSGCLIQVTAYRNRDGYTKNNLKTEERQLAAVYDKSRKSRGLTMVDIGYALIDKTAVRMLPKENVNFEAEIYPRLTAEKKLGVFPVEHRYYSVGSWERIRLAEAFFRPKKAVFLDRDGTLNVKAEKAQYISTPEALIWLPGVRTAIRLLKEHGYLVIIATNQPGIARGMVTAEQVDKIHQKMQADLAEDGCAVDAFYVCPHGWNEGCFCRKPSPGLLYQAQRDFSLNLQETVLMGDDERDLEAGWAAGCKKTVRVTPEHLLYDAVCGLLDEIQKEEG